MMFENERPQSSAAVPRTWSGLVGFFLPKTALEDIEARARARTFLISHLFGPPLGLTVPLALYLLDPAPGWDVAVLAASIVLFWVFPFLLRRGVAYDKLVLLSVVNLNFCTLFSCYANGGITSSTLIWILLIPILSLFYVGGDRKLQPHLLAIMAVSLLLAFLSSVLVPPPPKDIPDVATKIFGAVSMVAMLCYVAMMAIYYARVYDAGIQLEIEAKRRRGMAEELREAIVTAHRSGSAKAEFLAGMSHEIRTPINAIIGYAQILKEDAEARGDVMLREDIERILDAARYLVRLIDMILDLAEIGAGRMRFDVREHGIGSIIDDAVEALRNAPEGDRTLVETTVDPALGAVWVDRCRLLQILDCMLSNAARHARGGHVRIAAGPAEAGGADAFTISIADTGEGIEPEALRTLFETFATERHAAGGRYGGTGLKLAVCGQLCRAMGGTITAASVRGEGSTFTISLPLRPCAQRTEAETMAGPVAPPVAIAA